MIRDIVEQAAALTAVVLFTAAVCAWAAIGQTIIAW